MKRMQIFIDGRELINWTAAELSREKKDLTGSLSVNIFVENIPNIPIITNALQGQTIEVYIHEQIVFHGVIDKRRGSGSYLKRRRAANGQFAKGSVSTEEGREIQSAFGANGYRIELVARGKSKYLIDSSHRHRHGTILDTTDRQAIQALLEGHNIELDWQAEELPLNRVVFRDGAIVIDEIFRICNENCHFCYETADGKLRVVDVPEERGGDIILGFNIMEFSAEQSEDMANSEIIVKGHRSRRGIWGKDAILDTEIHIKDKWVQSYSPLTVQHAGEATEEALQRRAKWEADKRATESKQISLTVFDVIDSHGNAWDIGKLYYVEVPSEGIANDMECISLTYRVDAEGEISTKMTLAPPPSGNTADNRNNLLSKNKSENNLRSQRPENPNEYPQTWTSADIEQASDDILFNATRNPLLSTLPPA